MVLGLVGAAVACVARALLPVHDVATAYEPGSLPEFIDDRRPGGPQLVGAVRRLYGNVRPVVVESGDTAAVYAAALEAARAQGWRITAEEAPSRLQALAETRLLRFKDDIAVTVRPDAAGGRTRVDARSRSRVGQGDMGANGARLAAYTGALRAALAAKGLQAVEAAGG
ncbi:MAG: hypothetical protein J3K34DRAFT_519582 [Monoraphidium minutum]|nr:MAG: hypothetical protein J3K34DRAFT_519582 [Monoraphidium minutum]